jgi:hypothetical protein
MLIINGTLQEMKQVGEAALAENAIKQGMSLILKYLPQDVGNGWNVSNFHDLKHIVGIISTVGAPHGYNASQPEEHHKAHVKRPAACCSKCIQTILLD